MAQLPGTAPTGFKQVAQSLAQNCKRKFLTKSIPCCGPRPKKMACSASHQKYANVDIISKPHDRGSSPKRKKSISFAGEDSLEDLVRPIDRQSSLLASALVELPVESLSSPWTSKVKYSKDAPNLKVILPTVICRQSHFHSPQVLAHEASDEALHAEHFTPQQEVASFSESESASAQEGTSRETLAEVGCLESENARLRSEIESLRVQLANQHRADSQPPIEETLQNDGWGDFDLEVESPAKFAMAVNNTSSSALVGIDGTWADSNGCATIWRNSLTWNDGTEIELIEKTETSLRARKSNEDLFAEIGEDGNLHWSDGDIWKRCLVPLALDLSNVVQSQSSKSERFCESTDDAIKDSAQAPKFSGSGQEAMEVGTLHVVPFVCNSNIDFIQGFSAELEKYTEAHQIEDFEEESIKIISIATHDGQSFVHEEVHDLETGFPDGFPDAWFPLNVKISFCVLHKDEVESADDAPEEEVEPAEGAPKEEAKHAEGSKSAEEMEDNMQQKVSAFSVGQRVRCREVGESVWLTGIVQSIDGGKVLVQPEGWSQPRTWGEVIVIEV
jgi:hypothetical protein